MKKTSLVLILFISTIFSLTGCGEKQSDSVIDEYENHKKVLSLVNDFSVKNTNGFDYSLEQKIDNIVVNSHTISLRLDNSNNLIGSRMEYERILNEDISKGQFTEKSEMTYYKNNRIASYVDELWIWKNCTLEEFTSVGINSFVFDFSSLLNLNLSIAGDYYVLSFNIADDKSANFLGMYDSVKDLFFEIKTDKNCLKLISIKMGYSQNLTSTFFNFATYFGNVMIDIPK